MALEGISVTPQQLFIPRKDPVPIVQEAGRAPGPVRKIVENLVPTGIRSPDLSACNQSLYLLSYPNHESQVLLDYFTWTVHFPDLL